MKHSDSCYNNHVSVVVIALGGTYARAIFFAIAKNAHAQLYH
jgi:hypothetical protein